MSGVIYEIASVATGRRYIGSSVDYKSRWSTHKRELANGTHHNIRLLREYNLHGSDNFEFNIIQVVDGTVEQLRLIEQQFLDSEIDLLNTGLGASGGDNLSQHPNREEIILKRTQTQMANLSALSDEERIVKYGHVGESNGMFGKTHSDEVKEASSLRLRATRKINPEQHSGKFDDRYDQEKSATIRKKISDAAKLRVRELNPFFGKTHSDVTINAIKLKKQQSRMAQTIRDRLQLAGAKPLTFNGKLFLSVSHLSQHLNCTPGNVSYMIKRNKCSILTVESATQYLHKVLDDLADSYSPIDLPVAT